MNLQYLLSNDLILIQGTVKLKINPDY